MTEARKVLLVTGANGFVAGSVLAQADQTWETHALSRSSPPTSELNLRWHRADALDSVELDTVFRAVRPHAVIHTAALADIDFCQANPALARKVNVELTRALVDLCGESGARLVFCSTDTVFDGEHAPYHEEAVPSPVNFYAETKVAAEQAVAELGKRAVIARLALVMGFPVLGAGNSFVPRLVAALQAGKPFSMPEREVRTPIDVLTLGQALLELAGSEIDGIMHLGGLTQVNRFELGQRLARQLGLAADLVISQPPSAIAGRAARPRDVSLDTSKAQRAMRTRLRTLDEALRLIDDQRRVPALAKT